VPARSGVRETHHAQGSTTSPHPPCKHQATDPPAWRTTFNVMTHVSPPTRAIRRTCAILHELPMACPPRPWNAPAFTSHLHLRSTRTMTNNTSLHASRPRPTTSHCHAPTSLGEMPRRHHPCEQHGFVSVARSSGGEGEREVEEGGSGSGG
jgi:hypothetical protein